MHQYAQEREARFRCGVRVLVGAVVIPVTWFYTTIGLFFASGPWFANGPEPIRNTVLRGVSILLAVMAIALLVGLVRAARWRWGMAGAWAGGLVVIGASIAVISRGEQGTVGVGVGALGLAAAYVWAFVKFDPPAA